MVRLAVVYADFELKYFWYADFHPKKMPKMMCMLTSATPPSRPPLSHNNGFVKVLPERLLGKHKVNMLHMGNTSEI